MGHYRKETPTLFTRLAYYFGWKQRPARIIPPPGYHAPQTWPNDHIRRRFGPPAPQTSLIFELPDELILSILSHISPDPRLAGYFARFRAQYGMLDNDYHPQRVKFLRPLSMTCRAMRSRFLPWIWERLVFRGYWNPCEHSVWKLEATVNALHVDIYLGTNVKFMKLYLLWNQTYPLLVKCLKSLPNLHTLEMVWGDGFITARLKTMLKGIELPQIRTLILPPATYPLLKHCRNVEEVVCVVNRAANCISPDEFFGSLPSNRDSKLKRLAIPLVSWGDLSRHVAACPRLTELTVFYPHPDHATKETGIPFDTVECSRSAILELVDACRALPDFGTLQIVHFIPGTPDPIPAHSSSTERRNQELIDQMKDVKDWVTDCLRKLGTEGEERKKATLRVIEFRQDRHSSRLDSMKIEEYLV